MAYRKNMTIPTNADWDETWTWWVDTAKSAAKDLTGWTGKMQFRRRYGSQSLLAEVSTANGRMILGSGEGNIKVSLPLAVLQAIEAGEAVMDCVLSDPQGKTHELISADPEFAAHVTE